jgi:hypothetical protein
MVAPVIVVETLASLKPKGETASSATCTEVAVGAVMRSRPRPLVDHLLEARARAVAIHDVIECINRRLVDGAAREQVAIASLGIEQAQKLVHLRIGHRLRNGRSIAHDIRPQDRGGAHLIGNSPDALQRELRHLQPKIDLADRVVERLQPGRLRAQADREAAIDTQARIGRGLLAGGELALQLVELGAHVDQ